MSGARRPAPRFVKALCTAGQGVIAPDGGASVALRGRSVRLGSEELKALEAQGVIACSAGICRPTPQSRTFLRRVIAASGDFADQHRIMVDKKGEPPRNLAGSALLRLTGASGAKAFLSPSQIAAAERVCRWAERARLTKRTTMSYSPKTADKGAPARGAELSDMAIDARTQLNQLYETLPRDCADTIIDLCVFDKGLQEIETGRGWPRRSAKLVLRIGLERLSVLWGLDPVAHGPQRSGPAPKSWHDPSARPTRFE